MSPVIRAPYPTVVTPPSGGSGTGQWTDFSEMTVGAAPAGWTARWGVNNGAWVVRADSNSLSGKVLRPEFSANAYRGLTWDKAGSVQNAEVLALLKGSRPNDPSRENNCLVVGASGTAITGHVLRLIFSRVDYLIYNNGGAAVGASIDVPGLSATERIWARLSRSGTTTTVKAWFYGQPESSGVGGTYTNTRLLTGGLGFALFHTAGAQFEYFSYSLDASSAPSPL